MSGQRAFTFVERRRRLDQDGREHAVWHEEIVERTVLARRTAIIVCDMWDRHWSRGAAE